MELKSILYNARIRENIDLPALAAISRLDPTTINRVESGSVDVTLNTAMRLCNALNVTVHDVAKAMLPRVDMRRIMVSGGRPTGTISILDVEDFLKFFWSDFDKGLTFLAQMLFEVEWIAMSYLRSKQPGLENMIPFEKQEIKRMLFPSPIYLFKVRAPHITRADDYFMLFHNLGGVLTFEELGHYLKLLRKENKKALARIKQETSLSASVLSRLENGTVENIKLKTVVELDNHYAAHGTILSMYWNSTELNELLENRDEARRFTRSSFPEAEYVREITLAHMFIALCRWHQIEHGGVGDWIAPIRELWVS